MKKIIVNNDEIIYSFSKDNKPVRYVNSNDVIIFNTLDCFNYKEVKKDEKIKFPKEYLNPATGPIYINDADITDTLKVEILDVKVKERGILAIIPNCGALYPNCKDEYKIIEIKNKKAIFNNLKIKIDPMVGVIGTANDFDFLSEQTSSTGGNMDSNIIKKGTTLYLPIKCKGALLALGDLHALMGDGEIAGTGIEIAGSVKVRVSVIKNVKINYPISETSQGYFVNTVASNANDAIILGYKELARLLVNSQGYSYTDATLFMSINAIINANQACLSLPYENPLDGPTFRVGIKKVKGLKPLI